MPGGQKGMREDIVEMVMDRVVEYLDVVTNPKEITKTEYVELLDRLIDELHSRKCTTEEEIDSGLKE